MKKYNANFGAALLLLWSRPALASTSSKSFAWADWAVTIKDSITGPTAKALCIIALAACGMAMMWGEELTPLFKRLVNVVLAIAVALGAANAVEAFGVSGSLIPGW